MYVMHLLYPFILRIGCSSGGLLFWIRLGGKRLFCAWRLLGVIRRGFRGSRVFWVLGWRRGWRKGWMAVIWAILLRFFIWVCRIRCLVLLFCHLGLNHDLHLSN